MGNIIFAGLDSRPIRFARCSPAVTQERPPVCVTDCESLYDQFSAVGSPCTLQDKRSAINVLIIRESSKKTVATGLQLADGLTRDKGEAIESLRRSLRSGSYVLRDQEHVMQERQRSKVNKKAAIGKTLTVE